MLPCRIFLQKQQLHPPPPPSSQFPKPSLYLTLNALYYDQIKPFQTKYFCLTTTDVVGVEASLKVKASQGEPEGGAGDEEGKKREGKGKEKGFILGGGGSEEADRVGRVDIKDIYKLGIEGKVVEIKIVTVPGCQVKEIRLWFSIEPVMAFRRQIMGETGQIRNIEKIDRLFNDDQNIRTSAPLPQKSQPSFQNQILSPKQLNINKIPSFRDLKLREHEETVERDKKWEKERGERVERIQRGYRERDTTTVIDNFKSYPEQDDDSLESLAQQREKILGELFGRFKPIK